MIRPGCGATVALALAAGLGAGLTVACAGARPMARSSDPAAPAAEMAPLASRDDLRARIRQLDAEIATELAARGLDAPDPTAIAAAAAVPVADLRTTCTRSARDACQDVCKLGDSICANATAICELAEQLPGDAWAGERCGSGKAACQRASDRCCRC